MPFQKVYTTEQLLFRRKPGYILALVGIQETAQSVSRCSLKCLSSTVISCKSFEFESANNSCKMSSLLLTKSVLFPLSIVHAYEGNLSQSIRSYKSRMFFSVCLCFVYSSVISKELIVINSKNCKNLTDFIYIQLVEFDKPFN